MKRLFSTIIAMLLLCMSAEAQKTYAIITGVSNYEGDQNDLAQSTKDAKRLASLYKTKTLPWFCLHPRMPHVPMSLLPSVR